MAFTHEVTGTSSLLCIPVRAGRRTIGALAFGFTDEGSPADGLIPVAETLAELTGQALERAQRYEAEHATAHQLQQALLPKVPAELPGVCIGAAYLPAEPGQDVGGDWYDVFELPGGKIGCASGDVVGHDLAAAVAMGRLQLLLRYIALGGVRPTEVLEALDRACPALTGTDFATVAYAEYDPAGPARPSRTRALVTRRRCWPTATPSGTWTRRGRGRWALAAPGRRPPSPCRPLPGSSFTPTGWSSGGDDPSTMVSAGWPGSSVSSRPVTPPPRATAC